MGNGTDSDITNDTLEVNLIMVAEIQWNREHVLQKSIGTCFK
jgi:hypothetical protein